MERKIKVARVVSFVSMCLLAIAVVCLITSQVKAAEIDLGKDVYDCKWGAVFKGSGVSRNGVAYDSYAVIVTLVDSQAARDYYEVGPEVTMVGYLRYVSCTTKQWTQVRRMHFGPNAVVLMDTGIATDWNWFPVPPDNTMMKTLFGRACR